MSCDRLLEFLENNEVTFSMLNGMIFIEHTDGRAVLVFTNTEDGKYKLSSHDRDVILEK